jgi:hypothetical protein
LNKSENWYVKFSASKEEYDKILSSRKNESTIKSNPNTFIFFSKEKLK